MKKKIVSIYSSSFVFEKSNLWKVITKKGFIIKFNFFNNFQKINSEKNIHYLIIIIFFEDIYNDDQSFKSILKDIQKECINLSKKNDFKILIFFSNWYKENLLNSSKNYYKKNKSALYFNNFFYRNISKIHNCFTINLDNYFGEVGFINIFESRNWYLLKSRLSILGIKLLVNLIENTLFNFEIIKRKILILDCDNTLWGGVIGEDGISNIILGTDGMGQIYKDIQKEIINIHKKGILLALISKNNEEDVLNVFKKHTEMFLKLKHITSHKINWKNKYQNIKEISTKAKDGKLTIDDLQGGTFTISNGGIYGSMLSTPILNLPQSGVLGMHNIVDRPIVEEGEIKIRPIMYLALSYDHRIIDGKESVSFLKMIKENLEDPRRLFLDI